MAKGGRGQRRIASRLSRPAPYPLPSSDDMFHKKCFKALDKKDWEDVTCSVCMECPHKAVLLLCSSHDKGCRPYMCGTSFRYSNCLDQYKKAYTKVVLPNGAAHDSILISDSGWPVEKCEVTELTCPLCRGQVKGWTVVEPAREYLNAKKRSCMQDNCSFVGTFKELRKHMRIAHPLARPREVDPNIEQKWRRLEREREHDDVISTIRSTMPGAMVFGDYVIEGNRYGFDSDEEEGFVAEASERNEGLEVGFERDLMNVFFLLHAFGPSGDAHNRRLGQSERTNQQADDNADGTLHTSPVGGLDSHDDNNNDSDNNNGNDGISLVSHLRRYGSVHLRRSGSRRWQRR